MTSLLRQHSRWIILMFSASAMLGNYYCFDLPAGLKDSIEEHFEGHYSRDYFEVLYNTLFTAYSLPNIILPFLNGYLVDRFGSAIMLLILAFFVAVGQLVFCIGMIEINMWIMIAGRLIIGLGGESLFVAVSNFITKYFRTKELSFALGITLAVGNLGSMLNLIMTPRVNLNYGINSAASVGTLVAFTSFILVACVVYIDRYFDLKRMQADANDYNRISLTPKPRQLKDFFSELTNFRGLSHLYWYMCFCSVFLFSSILSWNNIAASYISEKWFNHEPTNVAQVQASNFVSLTWLTTVICGPLLGCFVDEYGVRTKLTMVASVTLIFGHLFMIELQPSYPAITIGAAYSIGYAAIGPSIAYLTDSESLGKANGIILSLRNLSFFIVPYFVAAIKISYGSYDYSEVLLIALAAVSFFCGYKSYKENIRQGHVLDMETEKLQDLKGGMVLELRESIVDQRRLLGSEIKYDDAKRLLDYGV